MDKTEKFLRKLTKEKRMALRALIVAIENGQLDDLDVKRLQGYWNIFRVRTGDFRIIFQKNRDSIEVLEATRRTDTTYRKY